MLLLILAVWAHACSPEVGELHNQVAVLSLSNGDTASAAKHAEVGDDTGVLSGWLAAPWYVHIIKHFAWARSQEIQHANLVT